MPSYHHPLFTDTDLYAHWGDDFRAWMGSEDEKQLLEVLRHWSAKRQQTETESEAALISVFFVNLWGYTPSGMGPASLGFTCSPKFAIPNSGARGGPGFADLALGYFDHQGLPAIPQAVCEFKDIRSNLDKPQTRKGNTRSPVEQCFDYLKHAFDQLAGHEPVQPTWGIVTDMNEFRLYWRKNPGRFQRFNIEPTSATPSTHLLAPNEAGAFQRYCFKRIFHARSLLSTGGNSELARLLSQQWITERKLEREFYFEYRAFREKVFLALKQSNPGFRGTDRELVRATQLFLDRCIFLLFCEDAGKALGFPPNLVRNLLSTLSTDINFNPDDTVAWQRIKQLFSTLRDGGSFGGHRVNKFNGGLFEFDQTLDTLQVPSSVFCARGQGANEERIRKSSDTLLYFSAMYHFGGESESLARPSIGLYTLGRIFEQSITDLELMQARAEGRESLTEVSKRKRDGVYYTPEWVTEYIVRQTLGARIADIRSELGLDAPSTFSDKQLARERKSVGTKPRKGERPGPVKAYYWKLAAFAQRLERLTVVDPACGSGAFLIQALDFLVSQHQWISGERARITGNSDLFDSDSIRRLILSRNIFGVDINPESVEIARLALWLHTAQPGKPLDSLNHNIVCGNSLVPKSFLDSDFSAGLPRSHLERINPFDWDAAFPEVFENGGFDCVIGNPPYVKLQNLRKVDGAVADWLVAAKDSTGRPAFESTQTSNLDVFLAFIEKGLSLLAPKGRMGYIAPSTWLVNDYGVGLRTLLARTRQLERWVDFGSFQVFNEATTYTALQFFTKEANSQIRFTNSDEGDLSGCDWGTNSNSVPYSQLSTDSWHFLPSDERDLITRLDEKCRPLAACATKIIVGVQTSADDLYHFQEVSKKTFRNHQKGFDFVDLNIEAEVIRPLVSGKDVKRFRTPTTTTRILFPYETGESKARLLSANEIRSSFPVAWRHLKQAEKRLRGREKGRFDNASWYAFGRSQNIDKQHLPKILVPRLTRTLQCAVDDKGQFVMDNVDVNGILATNKTELFFLAGVLNGSVANFVWRRRSRPFANDYRAANKQFLEFLPVPNAEPSERLQVAGFARDLQSLHSRAQGLSRKIDARLRHPQTISDEKPISWLMAEAYSEAHWYELAPDSMSSSQRKRWSRARAVESTSAAIAAIEAAIPVDSKLSTVLAGDELSLLADGKFVLSVVLPRSERKWILAQWRQALRGYRFEQSRGSSLVKRLLCLRSTNNSILRESIVANEAALFRLEETIEAKEEELNSLLFRLYKLSDKERKLIARR